MEMKKIILFLQELNYLKPTKMKKILCFISLISFGFAVNAQYAWVSQATGFTPVSTGVRNVSVVDANVVWIASYDGSGGNANRSDFSRTLDGGLNWAAGTVPVPASYNWSMIHAHNADTAWAMFYDAVANAKGGIYITTDGGASWAQQDSGIIYNSSTSFPNVVYFWDGLQGVAMGDPSANEFEIYTTVDAGNTWTAVADSLIPDPLAGEFGIVNHFSVVGDNFWFDTNKGRVYKSADRGLTWSVASTGITVPANGAIDICFYDANSGLARLYAPITGTSTMYTTSDGGATWNSATPTGVFFGADVKHVPGTPARLISTGSDFTNGFIGSSFSEDGGLTWTIFETDAQRTAIGAADSNNIWAGGFSTDPFNGGIFKYTYVTPVACGDTNITPGTPTANASLICPGDTLTITTTGVYAPANGAYSGVSWVISSADITGSTDPLNDVSFITSYTFTYPAPATSFRQLVSDGTFIGVSIPYGIYYWTPVVFGNAIAVNSPPVFLQDLALDPACTYTGTSVAVNVNDGTDPGCTIGIGEIKNQSLSVGGYFNGASTLDLTVYATKNEKANLTVIDLTGRVVLNSSMDLNLGENKKLINAAQFGSGIYLVKVETASLKAITKIVKQ
jgi:photosystem II stability/assembly factor-like uncharacterized protein